MPRRQTRPLPVLEGQRSLPDGRGEAANAPIVLADTFRLIHPDAKEVGTFHEFKGGRNGEKIDFIFTTPGLKLLDAAILHDAENGRYPSDHFPIMASMVL